MPDPLRQYRLFLRRVDALCRRLERTHLRHLSCRPGCTACCRTFSILPLEAQAILEGTARRSGKVRRALAAVPKRHGAVCRFLDRRGGCLIYTLRPLICRTHGLALMYLNDGGEGEPRWQLSFCRRNFRSIGPERWEEVFSPRTVINMEALNAELVRLNALFLASSPGEALVSAVAAGAWGRSAQRTLERTGRLPLSSLRAAVRNAGKMVRKPGQKI